MALFTLTKKQILEAMANLNDDAAVFIDVLESDVKSASSMPVFDGEYEGENTAIVDTQYELGIAEIDCPSELLGMIKVTVLDESEIRLKKEIFNEQDAIPVIDSNCKYEITINAEPPKSMLGGVEL